MSFARGSKGPGGSVYSQPPTASSTISASTQKLLANMMKEAGITSRHSRQLNESIANAGCLPANMQRIPGPQGARDRPLFGASAGRNLRGGTLGRGRKTAQTILREIENQPAERAPRGSWINREAEKDRFAMVMQYQGNVPEVRGAAKGATSAPQLRTRTKHYAPPGSNCGPQDVDLHARFAELASDIEENQAFLKHVEAAGEGHKHRAVVNGIIAERMREMREIDRKLLGTQH